MMPQGRGLNEKPALEIRSRRRPIIMSATFRRRNDVTLQHADCRDFLATIPSESVQLIVCSPPYNVGKPYEERLSMAEYANSQAEVIEECMRVLRPGGSICWQIGTYLRGTNWIRPLDLILDPIFERYVESHRIRLRNRIAWSFGHGINARSRFSGRYETILWYTKGDEYVFNLDAVRVPQKYPGKRHYKGARRGEFSGNPLGKNPGDVWSDIPNVKANHIEKVGHPCQFPVELPRRLILALTNPGDLVVDPFLGSGTTAVAAVLCDRRVAGCDIVSEYIDIARMRVELAWNNVLRVRVDKPIFNPAPDSVLLQVPPHFRTHVGE
jgi:adenine-specific DNA-methyltransferase